MVQYLKKHFPPGKRGYFVHTVDPWCKEDALLVLLNATPGKKGYAISYLIGGSDFMTHIRQKFTFGTVTFFSRYFGLFELFCGQSLL